MYRIPLRSSKLAVIWNKYRHITATLMWATGHFKIFTVFFCSEMVQEGNTPISYWHHITIHNSKSPYIRVHELESYIRSATLISYWFCCTLLLQVCWGLLRAPLIKAGCDMMHIIWHITTTSWVAQHKHTVHISVDVASRCLFPQPNSSKMAVIWHISTHHNHFDSRAIGICRRMQRKHTIVTHLKPLLGPKKWKYK